MCGGHKHPLFSLSSHPSHSLATDKQDLITQFKLAPTIAPTTTTNHLKPPSRAEPLPTIPQPCISPNELQSSNRDHLWGTISVLL